MLGHQKTHVAFDGLNPHAGKGGLFVDEEIGFIKPAANGVRLEETDVSGSRTGDTVFMTAKRDNSMSLLRNIMIQSLYP